MKRSLLIFVNVLVGIFFFAASAEAAIVNVTQNGEVVWNILSAGKPGEELVVKKTLDGKKATSVSLLKEGDKVILSADTQDGPKQANVSGYTRELVELEHKEAPSVIKIYAREGSFQIEQGGVIAQTVFPIHIDTEAREFSIRTPSGEHFLAILPREAAESLVRSGIITQIGQEGGIALSESQLGGLEYVARGERRLEIFNLFEFTVPVTASVSAATGQVIKVDQPIWLKLLGFMFA